jgi:hypothetical protein
LVELEKRGSSAANEGSIQPEGTARPWMAPDRVELRCHGRTREQYVMSWGREKTKRGIKYPVAVSNQIHRAA